MKIPNIADLTTNSGQPLTPLWFDLDNYDLEPDWTRPDEGGKMRTYHPAARAEPKFAPLDFT